MFKCHLDPQDIQILKKGPVDSRSAMRILYLAETNPMILIDHFPIEMLELVKKRIAKMLSEDHLRKKIIYFLQNSTSITEANFFMKEYMEFIITVRASPYLVALPKLHPCTCLQCTTKASPKPTLKDFPPKPSLN